MFASVANQLRHCLICELDNFRCVCMFLMSIGAFTNNLSRRIDVLSDNRLVYSL